MSDEAGKSWLGIGLVIFALLMVFNSGFRSCVISSITGGEQQSVKANASSDTIASKEDSKQLFENALKQAKAADPITIRDKKDMGTRLRLYKEALRLLPNDNSDDRWQIELAIGGLEMEHKLVGRWLSVETQLLPKGFTTYSYAPDNSHTVVWKEANGRTEGTGKYYVNNMGSYYYLIYENKGRDEYFTNTWGPVYLVGDSLTIKGSKFPLNFIRER